MSEDQADALTLATAFQAATDDDIRLTLNAMSNVHAQAGKEPLHYYIVPATWFSKAYPVLTSRTSDGITDGWKEELGRISNSRLMNVVERENSSDDEETGSLNPCSVLEVQKKRFDLMHRRIRENQRQSTMKPGLVHARDFFFLGPGAWALVKEKFDFDGYELARPVVAGPQNTLAIQLMEEESEGNKATMITIPPSGRFPYERVAAEAGSATALAIVPEDEDGNNESSAVFIPKPWESSRSQEDTKVDDNAPVLLLPPSTTSVVGPLSDNMEVEDLLENTSTPVFIGRKQRASGLANLGNTCFLNSSIQCLAHTGPLRSYFLSGEYARDLNKDNPLGTGGELATQFASLMGEMWGVAMKRRSVLGAASSSSYLDSSSGTIYPRSFKYCLGKHAEQFVGYDQHDSQEVATYLLDKLHEDTNRVTKKPYVEVPEQGEDESDDVAADKAWKLHQKREDSRVLENFMGQIKSRLECCQEGCNRISTTYDPFMFLSVPIPGSNDRKLSVTFVPLDPTQRMRSMSLTVSKTALVSGLLHKMNTELVEKGVIEEPIPLEDLAVADIWNGEIFGWLQQNSDADRIRDSDKTFVYQLRALGEVQADSKDIEEKNVPPVEVFGRPKRKRRYTLNLATQTRLNGEDTWQKELENYVKSTMMLLSLFNPKRGSNEERIAFYKKLETFIDLCLKEIDEEESTGTKRPRDGNEKVSEGDSRDMEEQLVGLLDRCDAVPSFKGVRCRQDVAILEFCANQLRAYTLRMLRTKAVSFRDGILIQVIMRRSKPGSKHESFGPPLVLRIPARMTVFAFRLYLAHRVSRSIHASRPQNANNQEPFVESPPAVSLEARFGPTEVVALRQVAFSYERKGGHGSRPGISSDGKTMGMVSRNDDKGENGRTATTAVHTDEAEKELVAELVGPNGTVYVDWQQDRSDWFFDIAEFNYQEPLVSPALTSLDDEDEKPISVMDCIEKYCQKEQLEETEMWYCNRCKDHVRAWKQFHIYRAPPILIVHLKRFHYSASTHRRNKITSLIEFPLQGLDLTHLVSHFADGQEPIYDCYAVSNHYGSLGGGHYTAYTLGEDGSWLHYDDSVVSEATKVITPAAYVLYYRRRDVEVGQDPIIDGQTAAMMVDPTNPSCVPIEDPANDFSQAVESDDVDDNMAVDGSSRTSPSPISDLGSVDGVNDEPTDSNIVSFAPESGLSYQDFPPLQ